MVRKYFLDSLVINADNIFLIKGNKKYFYKDLLELIIFYEKKIKKNKKEIIFIDFSWDIDVIAKYFAYLSKNFTICFSSRKLRNKNFKKYLNGGFTIFFSSGTTDIQKGIVHDTDKLLSQFEVKSNQYRVISLVPENTIGGFFATISTILNGGTLVYHDKKDPISVSKLIEKNRVDILSCSSSFLNYFLVAKAWERQNLSSLKKITYGSEPIHEGTILKLSKKMKKVKFRQRYGMTEIGLLKLRSLSNRSLYIKLNKKEEKFRVKNGYLYLKLSTSFVSYLDAKLNKKFIIDGWIYTGDLAVKSGDYFKVLGRESNFINMGGKKILISEIEESLMRVPSVFQAKVYPEKNIFLGQIICAEIYTNRKRSLEQLKADMIKYYRKNKIDSSSMPQRITIKEKSEFKYFKGRT